MTITSTAYSTTVAGNGATTTFSYTFSIYSAATASLVYKDAGGVQTTLSPSLWSITGAAVGGTGGTFTYPLTGSPIATGTTLTLRRTTPVVQDTSLPPAGPAYPPSVEAALDDLTMMVQEIPSYGLTPSTVTVAPILNPFLASATLALAQANLGVIGTTGGTMTGRLTVPGITVNDAAGVTITPIGNPALLAVSPVSGTTKSASQSELLFAINYLSNVGVGASVPLSKNKVALYVGMQADPGSGNTWAFNPLLLLTAGACALGGSQIIEADLANNSGVHFGDTDGVAGAVQPAVFGQQITGISTNRATAALAILGNLNDLVSPMWNRGIMISNNSCKLVSIADYGSAATSIDIRGTHANYGIDFRNGTCTSGVIRMGNQQKIVSRNAANNADLTTLQTSAGDSVVIGAAATPYVLIAAGTGIAPNADNTLLCGQSGARWSQVWAGNGAIQTSDPALKTDIETLDGVDVEAIIETIAPITFRFVDGGGGKPGKRTHWGFNAEDLGGIEALSGRDYGGFVHAEDGILGRRADQENAILWEGLRRLQRRVAELEALV